MNNSSYRHFVCRFLEDLTAIKEFHIRNERYLHHCFSGAFEKSFNSDGKLSYGLISEDSGSIMLHPEWATYVENGRNGFPARAGGLYRRIGNEYVAGNDKKSGSSGFIDFALGPYNHPEYAVEFKYGFWMKEAQKFDWLKLLDKNNPFDKALSVSFVQRKKVLDKVLLDKTFDEMVKANGGVVLHGRPLRFLVICLDNSGTRVAMFEKSAFDKGFVGL